MKRKYKKYTNLYMRYLKTFHEGYAYYLMKVEGKHIMLLKSSLCLMPLKSSRCFGSWHVINYLKSRYGTKVINRNLRTL